MTACLLWAGIPVCVLMDEQFVMVKAAGVLCRDCLHSRRRQSMGMRLELTDSVLLPAQVLQQDS